MTKYGKIYIEANTIEEAERDLEMIKALAKMGATSGEGSSLLGIATGEMSAPAPQKTCCDYCCGCCDKDDFEGTDDYEDEIDPYDEIADTIAELANGYIGPSTALDRITGIIADLT